MGLQSQAFHIPTVCLCGCVYAPSTVNSLSLLITLSHFKLISPQPSNFFEMVLAIFGPLLFHINFKNNSLDLIENFTGLFTGIALNLQIYLGRTNIFMTLGLPIYKHGIPKNKQYFINVMFSSHEGHSIVLCIISTLVYVLPKQTHHHHFGIITMYRKGTKSTSQITSLNNHPHYFCETSNYQRITSIIENTYLENNFLGLLIF